MNYSSVKIIFCVAVSLSVLMAPFALEIIPDGKAMALGSHPGNKGKSLERKPISKSTSWSGYKTRRADTQHEPYESRPIHPVPEPATMLLVGGGLAGMAMLRKKFKK